MTTTHPTDLTRRTFVGASAAGVVVAATAGPGAAASAAVTTTATTVDPATIPYVGAGSTAPVRPFPLHQVTLGDGLFQEKRDRMKAFLRQFDERRFLVLFNRQAGRPNPAGVAVPGGWEDGGLLSGHWAGHYMTALAQAHADGGEQVFKDKLDWMVTELAACQAAITARIGTGGGGGEPEEPDIGRVPGRFGNALRLNGPSAAEHVRLPQETVSQLSAMTIACWVNLGAAQNWSRVFDFGQGTAVNMFLTARAGVSGTPPRFAITVGGSGQEQRVTGGTALPVGQWVHLAVTLADGVGTLYVDGAVAGSNPAMTLDPTDLGVPGNIWLGRSQYGDAPLNASLDELHIFDRALSAAEVASLVASPAGTTGGGNIAWYRFDEDGGATVVDSSPNGRDAGVVAVEPDDQEWVPTHPGYLGAIPEDAVLRLGPPRFAVYGGNLSTNVWAPWYTQHKIMRGLLDAYTLTGNELARDVVVTMADWAHLALTVGDANHPDHEGPLTRDDLDLMWDTYIAGESGGANEVFPEVYALTGEEKHLATAQALDNRESLFGAARDDDDILVVTDPGAYGRRRPARLHANQHVPHFTGLLRYYEQSDDAAYREAAGNFYRWVVPHRMFANGGTGGNYPGSNNNIEMFQNRGNIANAIAAGGAESCTTYNLAKLAANLFWHQPEPHYMEYVERALFNQLAGNRADTTSVANPQVTYFQPLTPGVGKSYGNTGTCCGGSGLEIHTKYQETVWSRSADGATLWVNQYLTSTLTWAERDLVVRQETDLPRAHTSRLTIQGSGRLSLRLRVPHWAERGFTVRVNGSPVPTAVGRPSSYVTVTRDWRTGDTVDVSMPFSVRVERAPDRPDTQSIFWGPLLMPLLGQRPGGAFHELTLYPSLKLDGDYGRAVTDAGTSPAGDPLLAVGDLRLRPWYVGDTQAHSAYFRRVEPRVVFGAVDTGVPNRRRDDGLPDYDVPVTGVELPGSDGLTFLDVVWQGAPFLRHATFVSRVRSTAEEFLAAGLLSEDERDAVVRGAARAQRDLAV
ncbi:beta-L-arabinofuranosidase domain-containing protein [Aquipuribacter sp. MA13-6]|uniref:beta-L-arabinofuranosidase domain-containing protein n=1 Tax=unclassified Aquipuribacter TaxID=2635084 RepID=UPI003EEA35EA